MPLTLEQFGKSVVAAGILTTDELRGWYKQRSGERRPRDAETFSQALVDDGKLTSYQAKVLLQGKPQALRFGNYTLLSQLGSGASGHVFKAQHKTSGRSAAIKILAAEVARDPTSLKRFQREVEAAGRLNHAHIVRSFDAGEYNGQPYLVMDFVDGGDLASIVHSRGPLGVTETIHCALQAAEGLRFAHEQGIIHRDIKPGNLLLDKNGTVRILDLGLVRFEDSGDGLTVSQQVMGTVDYMSPEQSADTKRADARCDVYSLGVTLWYLLTGRRMYESKKMVERIMMHRSAPIPSLTEARPDAPPALERVFLRMVAKRPDERCQNMTEVIRLLNGVLTGEEPQDDGPFDSDAVEQSIMSLSKGDLAEFLRKRAGDGGGVGSQAGSQASFAPPANAQTAGAAGRGSPTMNSVVGEAGTESMRAVPTGGPDDSERMAFAIDVHATPKGRGAAAKKVAKKSVAPSTDESGSDEPSAAVGPDRRLLIAAGVLVSAAAGAALWFLLR